MLVRAVNPCTLDRAKPVMFLRLYSFSLKMKLYNIHILYQQFPQVSCFV